MMQAVILAGGEGSRMRPLTKNRPKAMIPVGGKPILGYVIESVVAAGIRDIVVVVGYKKEQVIRYLDTFDLDLRLRAALDFGHPPPGTNESGGGDGRRRTRPAH